MSELIVILGPTASGKTEFACHLAKAMNGEIISADSRQVYKGMDIGTGKDIEEYTIGDVKIPYHLIDIKEAGYLYNIAEYQLDFHKAFKQVKENKRQPILCGGSGLYIETALEGNKYLGIRPNHVEQAELENLSDEEIEVALEEVSERIKNDLNALTRARKIRAIQISKYINENPDWKPRSFDPIDYKIFGVNIDRNLRRKKISKRLNDRLNNGMIEEAERLVAAGLSHEQMAFYGLEYKWLSLYLLKEINRKELHDGLNTAIHQFSKRQMTWFRRMEKNGFKIKWINTDQPMESKIEQCMTFNSYTNR